MTRIANRTMWALSSLTKAALLLRPKRGRYVITERGREVVARNLDTYFEADLLEWHEWREYQAEIVERKQRDKQESKLLPVGSADRTANDALTGATGVKPEHQIEELTPRARIRRDVAELDAEVETELRKRLQAASPEFFELAVLELLSAMGYGGKHGRPDHVGKSHDGGIDGIIRQDALGLHNVYIQAKRYADNNSVGRPAIHEFYGSLRSRGTDRGVFITTSRFTSGAEEAARDYKGQIILIDGLRLTSLMLEYGVAVEVVETFTVHRVNDDFFDDAVDE